MSQLATTLTLIPATRRPANRYKRDGRGAWTLEEVWLKIKTQTSQTTLYVNRINREGGPHVNVKLETRVQHPTEDKTAMICVRASVPIVEKDHSFRSALAWMNDAWKTKFGKCFRVDRLFDLNGPQVYHAAADSNANVLHIVEGEVVEPNGNITICNIGHSHLDGSFGDLVLADDDMHLCGPESTLVLLFKQFERPPINVVDPPLPEGATRIIGIDNVLHTTLSRLAKPTPVLCERQKKSDWDPQHEYRFKGSSVWISSYRVNRFPNWMQVLASRENVTVYSFEPQKKRDRDENTTEISEGSAPPAKRLAQAKQSAPPGLSNIPSAILSYVSEFAEQTVSVPFHVGIVQGYRMRSNRWEITIHMDPTGLHPNYEQHLCETFGQAFDLTQVYTRHNSVSLHMQNSYPARRDYYKNVSFSRNRSTDRHRRVVVAYPATSLIDIDSTEIKDHAATMCVYLCKCLYKDGTENREENNAFLYRLKNTNVHKKQWWLDELNKGPSGASTHVELILNTRLPLNKNQLVLPQQIRRQT